MGAIYWEIMGCCEGIWICSEFRGYIAGGFFFFGGDVFFSVTLVGSHVAHHHPAGAVSVCSCLLLFIISPPHCSIHGLFS